MHDCQFLDNQLINYLICQQCQSVFKQPVRLHPCGHTFCHDCCFPPPGPCPHCRKPTEANQPDLTAINIISDLSVRCSASGCPFQGSYQAFMTSHRNSCPIRKSGSIQNWISQMQETVREEQPEKQTQQDMHNDPMFTAIEPIELQSPIDLEESDAADSPVKDNQAIPFQEVFIECVEVQTDQPQHKKGQTNQSNLKHRQNANKVIQL